MKVDIETEAASAVMRCVVETASARPGDGFPRNQSALNRDLSQSSSRRGV
jgi:hypothetical protein